VQMCRNSSHHKRVLLLYLIVSLKPNEVEACAGGGGDNRSESLLGY
jgi:hypothetical protein